MSEGIIADYLNNTEGTARKVFATFSAMVDLPSLVDDILASDPNYHCPQSVEEFIQMFPSDFPGISVYACTLLVDYGEGRCALGETSPYIWDKVRQNSLKPIAVLYAGDDRNLAIQLADVYNQQLKKKDEKSPNTLKRAI
ncbi:hypothetical protein [Anaerolinea sp.]|uniref:hypothetical protein n=1 Tax=Anaerolinea sp. TaxID=1872519 RepID=UPI002ACE088F|nr:hypothetical protein [Anaerolinea sp.]